MLEHGYGVLAALEKLGNGTPPKIAARLLSWQAGDVRELGTQADYEEAMRAADLYRKLGDSFHEGRVLLRAGTARLSPDSAEEGERLLREAHALVRPFGTTKTLAHCLSALASAPLLPGDLSGAHSLQPLALDVYPALGACLD